MPSKNPKKPRITEVVSIIAHQLKSPLSAIKGYLEALVSGDCGEINSLQKEYLEDALENIERMKKNIDDLLIVQRIEEGKYKIKPRPITLEDLTFEVLADFSLWAKALNCKIFFEKPEKLPAISGDPWGIRQVIENFISNAVKYSRGRGRVEVSIAFTRKGDQVIFSCKDNGISVPRKDFQKVFTKFYRGEKAMELDPSGSGLGLYINKAIIEVSGGKTWFTKNKGPGMTFYFSLPIAK